MKGRTYGYARVSTQNQNEARQIVALRSFGIPEQRIMIDKQSGKDFNRPMYLRLMEILEPGDLLVVKSIDRLGRNYTEILRQWTCITKEKHVHILVLDMPLLDTRERNADLTGTFIADLVLQILSYVAQTERDGIRQRQAEGIAAAKDKGVRFGRRPVTLPQDFDDVCAQYASGSLSVRSAAERLRMSSATFHRHYTERWGGKTEPEQTG